MLFKLILEKLISESLAKTKRSVLIKEIMSVSSTNHLWPICTFISFNFKAIGIYTRARVSALGYIERV